MRTPLFDNRADRHGPTMLLGAACALILQSPSLAQTFPSPTQGDMAPLQSMRSPDPLPVQPLPLPTAAWPAPVAQPSLDPSLPGGPPAAPDRGPTAIEWGMPLPETVAQTPDTGVEEPVEEPAEAAPLPEPELAPTLEEADPPESVEGADRPFQVGDRYWYVQGAVAPSIDEESHVFGLAGVGITHFFADGHSANLELNGIGFSQPGDEALGLNLALILRWHAYRQENWSLYIDGGAGILGTTSEVPSSGTRFNFTPQVGGGATIRLDDRQQLMLGLRWHHISNANLSDQNPGRDTILGYVGLSFPR